MDNANNNINVHSSRQYRKCQAINKRSGQITYKPFRFMSPNRQRRYNLMVVRKRLIFFHQLKPILNEI